MSNVPAGNPVDQPAPERDKKPARPGSQWATGKRKQQSGISQPKGFARGARVR